MPCSMPRWPGSTGASRGRAPISNDVEGAHEAPLAEGRGGRGVVRRVVAILAIKLLALLALYFAFFGPEHRPAIVPDTVHEHLLGRPPSSPEQ